MAQHDTSERAHICSCGVSFDYGFDPPDDNATSHILTDNPCSSDSNKQWIDTFCSELGQRDLSFLTDHGESTSTTTEKALDTPDGCFTDVGFKILKATIVVLLRS
ncbi:hypothetical protein DPX16_0269 [Anabarilius grahami]|uniref:Uncharacterized protein n=1 Tax=Anabarilius grahami TaxID=495550 RepID=A0A3N0XUX2_ANAGA|nr:hypothetical protein DPX16_0269 [Anabarilius grahami]